MALKNLRDVRKYLNEFYCGEYVVAFADMPEASDPPSYFDCHVHKAWELKLRAPEKPGGHFRVNILAPGVPHYGTRRDIAVEVSHHRIVISVGADDSLRCIRLDDAADRANLIPELLQIIVQYPPDARFDRVRHDLVSGVLANLLLLIESGGTAAPDAGNRPPVEIARDYMETYYYKTELGVADIARFAGISPQSLNSAFRNATGQTTRQTLIAIRLERARELLTETNYRVKDVAALTGWHSPFYFSNCYRRRFGIPPGRRSQLTATKAPRS